MACRLMARDVIIVCFLLTLSFLTGCKTMDQAFEDVAAEYLDRMPALFPVSATALGDHRFDGRLNQVSRAARKAQAAFYLTGLGCLGHIDRSALSRANQIDYTLLEHELKSSLWFLTELREWEWNPLVYTGLSGNAIYGLMARDFAPIETRLKCAADRLEQFPRLFEQVRATLKPALVPKIHAETAVKQNKGVLSIIAHMIRPVMDRLDREERARLSRAIDGATEAVQVHQAWLENELLPRAAGDFRLGRERYDRKLAWVLNTDMDRDAVRKRAEAELKRVRQEMYLIARPLYAQDHPDADLPDAPAPDVRQKVIEAALEKAYQDRPARDQVVAEARQTLVDATAFVREKDLVTIPPDPVEIIIMPEFQRGVSIAYCSSPGPLDTGQKTFYAVSPLPEDWTDEQVDSFLREYNSRSLANLTVHEAMPGHFLQLAHANRYPGRLRSVLASGVFIEGWAVYTESMMCQAGFPDDNPLSRLVIYKWYLRGIANALMDQAIHAGGMNREAAMTLMTRDTFQEEREAAAKWVRAQLTSAQLSTYFVGVQEHWDLRRDAEKAWSQEFSLKRYHDAVISFGSPPTRFVRAMMFDDPIPES